MKLTKVLCVVMLLAVVFSFAACDLLFGSNTPEPNKYTVEFDSAGADDVASQTVEENQLVTKPADPTKEGYTFLGWFLGETEWNFATDKVTKSITLIAKWQKNEVKPDPDPEPTEYTISYFDGDKALNLTPNKFTSESTGLTLPAGPDKAHYEFAGWYADANFKTEVAELDVKAGKNLTLYAKYQAKSYKITYNLDNGVNNEANPTSYTVETLPVQLLAPTKDGYDFLGWYTEYNYVNKIESVTVDNIGNLDLYAKWELTYVPPVTYTITYVDHNGETITGLTPAEYQESASDIILPGYDNYNKETHIFKGWKTEDGQIVTVIAAGTAKNIVLTAVVEEIPVVSYTVTYYIDGEQYGEAVVYEENTVVDLIAPAKAGHTFSGWTKPGQTIPVTSITVTSDVSLYGTFTAIDYTITYMVDGVAVELTPATYQISDVALALAEVPAKEGFKIIGWVDADGNKVTEIKAGQTGDVVVTAQYEEIIYTITYELQGGVNNAENATTYRPGDEVPTLYNPENRTGYLFCGWYTSASYTEEVTTLEGLNGDITLWAKWIPYAEAGAGSTLTPEVPL